MAKIKEENQAPTQTEVTNDLKDQIGGENDTLKNEDKIEDITEDFEQDLIKNAKEEKAQEPIKDEILEGVENENFTEDKTNNKSAVSTILFIIGGFILVIVSVIGFFIFKSDHDMKEQEQESAPQSAQNGLNGF
jgi:hypothetical protein